MVITILCSLVYIIPIHENLILWNAYAYINVLWDRFYENFCVKILEHFQIYDTE